MTDEVKQPEAQEEVAPNPTVSITLPVDSVNTVLGILAKQPFDMVADLIISIRGQAIEQLQAAEAK